MSSSVSDEISSDEMSESNTQPGDPEYIPGQGTEIAEIPVQIKDGEVQLNKNGLELKNSDDSDGEEKSLPDLRDGTTGTLRVRASAFEDDQDRSRFTDEHLEIIVPRSNLIWLKIGTGSLAERPEFANTFLENKHLPTPAIRFSLIPVALQEHLWLRHRGAKNPVIEEVECALPKGLCEEAINEGEYEVPKRVESLHQAYHALSEIFETNRQTHGGNVYKKGYLWNPNKEEWLRLEKLRDRNITGSVWGRWSWLRPYWQKHHESPPVKDYDTMDAWLSKEEDQMWSASAYPLDPLEEDRPRTQAEAAKALDNEGYEPSIQVETDEGKVPPKGRNWERRIPWEV